MLGKTGRGYTRATVSRGDEREADGRGAVRRGRGRATRGEKKEGDSGTTRRRRTEKNRPRRSESRSRAHLRRRNARAHKPENTANERARGCSLAARVRLLVLSPRSSPVSRFSPGRSLVLSSRLVSLLVSSRLEVRVESLGSRESNGSRRVLGR